MLPGEPLAGYELESTWVHTFSAVWQIHAIPVKLYADASLLASVGLQKGIFLKFLFIY